MHAVLARTLRGIEWIASDEVRTRFGVDEIAVGHRELRFALPSLSDELLALGTVDDVFLVLGEVEGLTRRRDSLARLASLSLNLDEVAGLLGRPGPRTFRVTASFLGRRNYNRFELEAAISAPGWTRVARGGTLSLRVHVVGEVATIAARIARVPLHRRAYRVVTVPGSIHPPLARALVLLARAPAIVDPFCGAGTIPIEAALAGSTARGSDVQQQAIAAARRNAAAAGVGVPFSVADSRELGYVDCVVTNPPWGKAVPALGEMNLRARRLVLLTAAPTGLDDVVHEQPVRVHGALATITVVERDR
jgi:tRNA (guanine6-N2)-methyltransferase